jgi:hypothetical protein
MLLCKKRGNSLFLLVGNNEQAIQDDEKGGDESSAETVNLKWGEAIPIRTEQVKKAEPRT